jgi:hypothetical protein
VKEACQSVPGRAWNAEERCILHVPILVSGLLICIIKDTCVCFYKSNI